MTAQPPVQPQQTAYGQPEPFDPATVAPPMRRVVGRSSRPWLPIVAAVVLAAVGFGAGFAVANATSSSGGTGANGDANQRIQGFGPGASFRPRNGGFGGGAAGTVGSVSANQMTITTAAGGQRIVLLTPTTTVTQVSSATKALTDLASGQTVTVIGTSNPDGSVTATRIVIGDVSIFGRGAGSGPAASAAP